jgi:hypothetical protein
MDKIFKVSDDSGFMGLVNVGKYDSFVSENWNFNDLKDRFIREMNQCNLLLWTTGQEGFWNVRITTINKQPKPFRTIIGAIHVTAGKLFLINYEDLSMAAQFQDEKLPLKHNEDLAFTLENGYYEIQINQLFNPENFTQNDSESIHFEIIINKSLDDKVRSNRFDEIPWKQ